MTRELSLIIITMKTNIDDATLQDAIDVACNETAKTHEIYLNALDLKLDNDYWADEAPARLALARALLARLPEPTPPTLPDGKTPVPGRDLADHRDTESATFEAHGTTWTRHSPGDPMPVDSVTRINVLMNDGIVCEDQYVEFASTWACIIGWRYAGELAPEPKPWQPAVGDVVKANPVQDTSFMGGTPRRLHWSEAGPMSAQAPDRARKGGQMYWRDLALQLAEVWWKCHNIGASLQHGDIDTDVSFSVVCEQHGGQCFHADTPHNAWLKAEKWLMSPDRANFPASTLTTA